MYLFFGNPAKILIFFQKVNKMQAKKIFFACFACKAKTRTSGNIIYYQAIIESKLPLKDVPGNLNIHLMVIPPVLGDNY